MQFLNGKKTWLGILGIVAPKLFQAVADAISTQTIDLNAAVEIVAEVLTIVGVSHKLYKGE